MASVTAGTRLVCDNGFSCLEDGQVVEVLADADGSLYVDCGGPERHHHYIDGQLTVDGTHYVGFKLETVGTPSSDRSPVFVFGSNLAGRHGAGAALFAYQHRGAALGVGTGMTGNSYAIPTKDERIRTRGLVEIERSVIEFIRFAEAHPEMTFQLTPIGCGLAGYKPEQIAPMFKGAPANVLIPQEFAAVLSGA
ncbi:A1S_2505 family phage non-structural protein [Ancylobacter rudongensis]|uniref:A1S_2505 family phage non-structural protein n=1 Tax=Ancylobacter rudongensis TaxID=177413 RepID=UPI001FCDE0CB|nr:hypothetical protein [Ancylobacter rudongensis]